MSKKDEAAVTRAYLRRITGYDVTETQEEYKLNEEGRLELQKRTEKTKHVPGDPRAAEFWLANRLPERWKVPRLLTQRDEEDSGDTGVIEMPPVGREPEGEADA